MTATFKEASDAMQSKFKTAWDASATNPDYVDYENVPVANGITLPPDANISWARVTIRNVTGNQESFSRYTGQRRFRRAGVMTVQIFIPLGTGLSELYSLGKIVTDAFQSGSTTNQVWFRNVRLNEVGSDGEFYQGNVLIDFVYSEIT